MAEHADAGPRPPAEVVQRLLTEDANLVASLEGVAGAGCALLGGCDAASITIIQTGRPQTIAATAPIATEVDRAQYDAGDGPCLEAARTGRVILVPRTAEEHRWQAFGEAARRVGVASSLSVPLVLPGPDTFGGLNCYGTAPDAFDPEETATAERFALQAAAVVSNAIAYWTAYDQAEHLARAMVHRAVIEQAKGILMGQQHCTADEAFDVLRRASQRENRKLRDVALDLVERTVAGEAGPS